MTAKSFEPQHVYVVSDLAQLKVLADPLRVRILEALCRDEATTKQVAETLGEKPTKLYHHVEALERVGLIRLTRRRQNRGTLEKYFRAVARSFRADAGLFTPPQQSPADATLPEVVSVLLDRTREELSGLTGSPAGSELTEAGVLGFCEVHATQARIDELRGRLQELLADLGEPDEATERRYRLTLAFYPLDRSDPSQ